MTGREYLDALARALSQLPNEERDRQLAYYEEMLQDMAEDGASEEAAVARLGDPQSVAEEILREMPLGALVKSRVRPASGRSWRSVLLLVLGAPLWLSLLIALLATLLAVWVALWSVVISLYAAALAAGLGGLGLAAGGVMTIFASAANPLMLLGFGFAAAGAGILLFLLSLLATKGQLALTRGALRAAKNALIRREA